MGQYVISGWVFVWLIRYHDILMVRFAPRQREFITLKLMNRMMKHSAAFYTKNFAGNLTNKINEITIYIPELIDVLINDFLACFLTLVFAVCNIAWVQARFAWALLAWLAIFLGGALFMLFRNSYLASNSAEARSQVVGHIVDMLANMMSIRLFSKAHYEKKLLKEMTTQSVHRDQKRDLFSLRLHLFQGVSFWIFEALCFWWLLNGLSDGSITPGGFILVFTMNLQILDQFWKLSKEIRQFWEKIGSIRQALKMVYQVEDMPQLTGTQDLRVTHGEIIFDHVQFFYEHSMPLFEDKTIVIPGKQKVGLVGYSGSGKSTFINLILRLYEVNAGRILIDGQNIQQVTKESLYASISVIPQDCLLFNRSIFDNLRYGRFEATEEEVYEVARKAQIHDVISHLPQGYHTVAGDRGGRLSGGQRQRVTIARAILKDAPILIIDEATSHQDGMTESKLKSMFAELMANKTVLLVAHRLTTLEHMDRILVFDKGHIIQDGTHEELLNQEGLYRLLWNSNLGARLNAY